MILSAIFLSMTPSVLFQEPAETKLEAAKRNLEALEAELGPGHPEVAQALFGLARLLGYQGANDEAKPLVERAIAIQEKALGPDHLDTIFGYAVHGALLQVMGAYSAARARFSLAWKHYETQPEQDVQMAYDLLSSLGYCDLELGNYDSAIRHMEHAFSLAKETVREWDLVNAYNMMAQIHSARQEYGKEEAFRRKALETCISIDPHRKSYLTITSIIRLADALRSQASFVEARPLYEQAMSLTTPRNPKSLSQSRIEATLGLGCLLLETGRSHEAAPLLRSSLEMSEKLLGPESPHSLVALDSIAKYCSSIGDHSEALVLQERLVTIYKKVKGPEHDHTASAINNLAITLSELNQPAKAKALLEESLSIRKRQLGNENPKIANALANLAAFNAENDSRQSAGPLYREAIRIYLKALGEDHPLTTLALYGYGSLLSRQGAYFRAHSVYQQAFQNNLLHLRKNLYAMTETERFQYLDTQHGSEPLLLNLVAMQGNGPKKTD